MKIWHLVIPVLLLPLPAMAANLEIRGVVACAAGLAPFVFPADSGHCLSPNPLLDDGDIVSIVPAAGTPWPYSVTIGYGPAARQRLAAFGAANPDQRLAVFVNGTMAAVSTLAGQPADHLNVMLEGPDMEDDLLGALGGKRR
jgi:hypothetical protein